ncbi:TPA: restriction endonuclease subunit S [Streptococcus suis]
MTRMKDSGIEWIGEMPEEWGIKPIKHIFGAIGSGTTPDSSKVEYYDGNINWLQSGDLYKKDYVYAVSKTITDLGYRSSASLRIYQAPFLAIAMYGASIGNLAISKIDACVNQAVAVLKGEENIVRFTKLALEISKTELIFAAQGGTQPNINQVLIKNWVIPFPSEIEIKKIADFLDKKVAQLDKVKSLLEEQIKTLEDYRQSLIYETVTKGLDKTVPLKDSGVDWIGQIPEGWGVKPIKYLVTYDDEVLTQSVINSNKLINYVDIGSVNLVDGISKYQELSTLDAPSRARRIAQKGDTIISTVRTYLKAIAFVEDDYIVSTGFCVLRPRKINNRYFNYAIMSNSFTELVSKYAWGVSYPAISASQLVNIPVSYPKSANEQILIADFLDKKIEQINQMIAIKKEQIENINKQRQTLIYDYVTGKRRV